MKRNSRLIIAIATITLITSLGVSDINAVAPSESSSGTNGTICVEHGPYTRTCSGVVSSITSHTHTFEYQGYTKKCKYTYVHSWTNIECDVCDYTNNRSQTHSHGYRGHDQYCGWINGDDSTCYL
jgi:hypothetical protein